jgi:fused signal recognition particle receptor
MIKWFKRNHPDESAESVEDQQVSADPSVQNTTGMPDTKEGIFARFKRGLSKTKHQLGDGLARLLLGKKEISPELLEELETQLILADIGINATQDILKQLTEGIARKQLSDGETVYDALKLRLKYILEKNTQPLSPTTEDGSPFVILMVGVNGAGKTTTIGKLARQFQSQGKKVMLAAGDTFRAAAIEQLCVWGERNGVAVISQQTGSDSASVIYDALQAASARNIDVLIVDTAGRLHTQDNLMEELKKVKRVLHKQNPSAPHETMLVLDAGIGQNALMQAREFHGAIGLTGLTMTKLDGTAKGGILFAIANELAVPFRYIGVGEGIDDLKPFDATEFVDAIF